MESSRQATGLPALCPVETWLPPEPSPRLPPEPPLPRPRLAFVASPYQRRLFLVVREAELVCLQAPDLVLDDLRRDAVRGKLHVDLLRLRHVGTDRDRQERHPWREIGSVIGDPAEVPSG